MAVSASQLSWAGAISAASRSVMSEGTHRDSLTLPTPARCDPPNRLSLADISLCQTPSRSSFGDSLSPAQTRPSNDDSRPLNHAGPPPLSFTLSDKKLNMILWSLGLVLTDFLAPIVIYWVLKKQSSIDLDLGNILGISASLTGAGELFEFFYRTYFLLTAPSKYAPLGQTSTWHMDPLNWCYLSGTIIAIVFYALSTSIEEEPILWLFLITPALVIAPFVVASLGTAMAHLFGFEQFKPFAYYAMDDFIAVDAKEGRAWRRELLDRWNASKPFRRMMWALNLWWTVGGILYIGALAAVTWGTDFDFGYGLVLGLPFLWIGLWIIGTCWYVQRELAKENEWFKRYAGVDDIRLSGVSDGLARKVYYKRNAQ